MLILAAPAYAEEDGYYESNEDGSTHTHYYYSDYSDEEYSFAEYCTWEDSYYDYLNYGQDGHYHYYTCPYCCGKEQILKIVIGNLNIGIIQIGTIKNTR